MKLCLYLVITFLIKKFKNLLICRSCSLLGDLNIALCVINTLLAFHLSFNFMDFLTLYTFENVI